MKVEWKRDLRFTRAHVLSFFGMAVAAGLMFVALGRPMWGVLALGLLANLLIMALCSRLLPKLLPPRSVEITDGGLKVDSGSWALGDVDSVSVTEDELSIRLYRSGDGGDEFVARSREMPRETWLQLVAIARELQAKLKPSREVA
jgi:hypothetical protein